ncbi:serine/arginine repetitive matrix protein 1-like isoform X2 [Macrobrachium nipponense]|uniref:serine/arginine repetitive matrix protein 1-like isoform X2 n=1 Tax=Macrobrachium nipponense TaxID=159736 RepID=UPI0030C800B3
MAQDREVLLKRLTGLLKRITDSDDDYTVTADQRAALMELETLTWNYPTPQQGRGRGANNNIPTSSFPSDDQTDTDDDDDDDSYYVDMVPYDITERLKEINRAFIEDPTPAECNRAITVRFRDVIADYQSPREYYPSDSDDGYGDSSDLVYDAEDDECGMTTLATEVRDILSDNVNVIDFLPNSADDNIFSSYLNLTSEDSSNKDYRNLGLKGSQGAPESGKVPQGDKKADVPRLQLNGKQEDSEVVPSFNRFAPPSLSFVSGPEKVGDFNLLKVDDSGLADLESFMKESEPKEVQEDLPKDSSYTENGDVTVSLIEPSDPVPLGKEFSSLDTLGSRNLGVKCYISEGDNESSVFFHKKEPKDQFKATSDSQQGLAKSDADVANFEYADDFEDSPDEEEEEVEESAPVTKEVETQPPASPSIAVPSVEPPVDLGMDREVSSPKRSEAHIPERKSKQGQGKEPSPSSGHKSRHEQSKKTPQSPSTERKRRPESKSPPVQTTEITPPVRPKLKRVSAGPPTIKPALLSSDKISHMKTSSDPSKYKARNSTLTRSATSVSTPSLASSSSSASSSPSSSSYSSTGSGNGHRGRGRMPISGPVRPTQHKPSSSSQSGRASNSRGVSRSPVRTTSSSTSGNTGLAVSPAKTAQGNTTANGRPSPPYRVRKAASASDLHSRMTDDPEDRKYQSDAVFKAWLQQKNKQAALAKKHQRKTSSSRGGGGSEVVERRARAEEAFQAWLARKREQLRLEKKLRGERRRLEDQSSYARTKAECEVAYKEWCRRKRDEVRTMRPNGVVPRSQSLERPWVQEKTRKLYSAYMNGH